MHDKTPDLSRLDTLMRRLASIAASGVGIPCVLCTSDGAHGAHCDEPGSAFLATECLLHNHGAGAISFRFTGQMGSQEFTFASGTTATNIAAAINTFALVTGIRADYVKQSTCAETGVEVRSIMGGANAFVSVQQLNGAAPLIAAHAGTPPNVFAMTDYGQDAVPGDVNCDRNVSVADLNLVLQHWGACPPRSIPCPTDLNQDGATDVDDLLEVIRQWGATG